ncbi:histidinol dehydrogenase [Aureivirga sp. CE67]|uniref:histidinol dehydrogenase n=1 Tax=Aureivirga sp. CE67 TaxID=1788983 RepID=UPI0018CA0526|nr:histidinol dehydrogenase [Aureivirga sp. CE67]
MVTINNPAFDQWDELSKRPLLDIKKTEKLVYQIFSDVQKDGDSALRKYTKLFDKADISDLKVSAEEINDSIELVSDELKSAILFAKNNIRKFHVNQLLEKDVIETSKGIHCWQEPRAIEKVGFYIPNQKAPLFSTILMLGIPAMEAGCEDIILCTPPDENGNIHPAILFTAHIVGITNIYKVGGIQAIAAMSFGTESIQKVFKIFGPGNQYVAAAKHYASSLGVAIDMPTGPSELLVVADEKSRANFVASDLLSQLEHGEDSQVVCISNNLQKLEEIKEQINIQIKNMDRKEIIKKSLKHSKFIYFSQIKDEINFINYYAPEHIILNVSNEDIYTSHITNAGTVFIGEYTPESAGDYATGTNHTLPTNGYAKMYSGISVDSFIKKITFQKINKEGLKNIGPVIEIMAEAEGLKAHKHAVAIRLNTLFED